MYLTLNSRREAGAAGTDERFLRSSERDGHRKKSNRSVSDIIQSRAIRPVDRTNSPPPRFHGDFSLLLFIAADRAGPDDSTTKLRLLPSRDLAIAQSLFSDSLRRNREVAIGVFGEKT